MMMEPHLKHLLASIILSLTIAFTTSVPVPAPTFINPYEKYTNQTIDQLITSSLGGTQLAANQIMDFGENILAELDMFLTKDQFLNMYQPPQPDDMMAMGMMPAPLGTEYDAERKNFFAPSERSKREAVKPSMERKKRKAARDVALRWTNSVMPYKFANGHFNAKEEYMMRRAMSEWERYTCVRFRPSVNTDKNSVQFQNGIGCNSQLGMVGGIQMLNLQAPGCRFKGLYLHEIGHALGLVHEHQLPNRDQYIRILYRNVSPSMRIWFNKYTTNQVNQMNVPYQLSSVMHYGITAFSKDGKAQTIEALDKTKEDTIGRVYLKELAYTDVEIVNFMYKCGENCPDKGKCGPRGHLDQNCNCICEDGSSDCDRTKRNENNNCANTYDSFSCYIWANQGECERNPMYMQKYCTKACHACGGETDDDGTCKDVYKEATCSMWKKRGDCVTNPGWMKRNCKATCNLCVGNSRPEVNCEDNHPEKEKCKGWALEGECIVNAKWMFKNCRKSCQYCDKDDVDKGGNGGGGDEDKLECKNTHKNCEMWAGSNECVDNPDWMIANCRKACNKCDDGKCKNLYDDTKCEIWQQKMECLSNSKWMARNCAKACLTGTCAGGKGGSTSTTRRPSMRTTARPGTRTTVRPVTSSPTCKNLHNSDKQCEMWAKNDHCNINPSWMLKNCAKACKRCEGASSTTVKTVTTTDSSGGRNVTTCVDTNGNCAAWAKHGYCDQNPSYNLIHCKKSCNNCNGCRDTEVLCSVWAEAGHCNENPRYMLRQCQKSCRACYIRASDMRNERSTRPDGAGLVTQPIKETNKAGENSSPQKSVSAFFVVMIAVVSACTSLMD